MTSSNSDWLVTIVRTVFQQNRSNYVACYRKHEIDDGTPTNVVVCTGESATAPLALTEAFKLIDAEGRAENSKSIIRECSSIQSVEVWTSWMDLFYDGKRRQQERVENHIRGYFRMHVTDSISWDPKGQYSWDCTHND